MSAITRREFCKTATTSAAAMSLLSAGVLKLHANPLGLPIGCQTWPVRDMIAKDFPGTLNNSLRLDFRVSRCARQWVTATMASAAL
jgi:hypothetical protein